MQSSPLNDPEDERLRQALLASRPERSRFSNDEDHQEALGFWHSRQGRLLGTMAARAEKQTWETAEAAISNINASGDLGYESLRVKIVGMLQHNWAMLSQGSPLPCVLFIDDDSTVFDALRFETRVRAMQALRRNGFKCLDDEDKAFLTLPRLPLTVGCEPSRRIYSSGKFWK